MQNKSVGELIAEAREKTGISKNQLAEMSKVSHTEIARIESGEREIPNPKTLRKISKFIGINYNDLMYAAGLGAKISPLNPYLLEYYSELRGAELRDALNNIDNTIKNNEILIESLKKSSEEKGVSDENKNVLLETIEDIEYQNNTNNEIKKLLESTAIKEFKDGKND
jgi:HTH-type transcriptional regulator, competence development regulator